MVKHALSPTLQQAPRSTHAQEHGLPGKPLASLTEAARGRSRVGGGVTQGRASELLLVPAWEGALL